MLTDFGNFATNGRGTGNSVTERREKEGEKRERERGFGCYLMKGERIGMRFGNRNDL